MISEESCFLHTGVEAAIVPIYKDMQQEESTRTVSKIPVFGKMNMKGDESIKWMLFGS